MTQTREQRRFLPCRVGDEIYSFDTRDVQTVMQGNQVTYAGGRADGQTGKLLIQGTEIPVLRLSSILGDSDHRPAHEHVVVVSTREGACGFLVDVVLRACRVPDSNIQVLPSVTQGGERFFRAVLRLTDHQTAGRGTSSEAHSDTTSSSASLVLNVDRLCGLETQEILADASSSVDLGRVRIDMRDNERLMLFAASLPTPDGSPAWIALSVTQVLEVTQSGPALPVPGSQDMLHGLIEWRHHFIPLIALEGCLGLVGADANSHNRIVVARCSNRQIVAFPTTGNVRTIRLPIETTGGPASIGLNFDCIRFSCRTEDGVLILPSLEQFAAMQARDAA